MNSLKRLSGILWIILSGLAIWFIWTRAGHELSAEKVDPSKKIFWYSILPVYTPLMLGLAMFGFFAIRGEYDHIHGTKVHK